jgi:hypothetical protein
MLYLSNNLPRHVVCQRQYPDTRDIHRITLFTPPFCKLLPSFLRRRVRFIASNLKEKIILSPFYFNPSKQMAALFPFSTCSPPESKSTPRDQPAYPALSTFPWTHLQRSPNRNQFSIFPPSFIASAYSLLLSFTLHHLICDTMLNSS